MTTFKGQIHRAVRMLVNWAAIITVAAQSACAAKPAPTVEASISVPALEAVPVDVIGVRAFGGGYKPVCGVFLDTGAFRVVAHELQFVPGRPLREWRGNVFLNGEQVFCWAAEEGTYLGKSGAAEQDWAHLKFDPAPTAQGLSFEPHRAVPAGSRVYVVGFDFEDPPVSTDGKAIRAKRMVRTAVVIDPPAHEESPNTESLLFIKPERSGFNYGWSGAPIIVLDETGRPVVLGSIARAVVPRAAVRDDGDLSKMEPEYVVCVRSGPGSPGGQSNPRPSAK